MVAFWIFVGLAAFGTAFVAREFRRSLPRTGT